MSTVYDIRNDIMGYDLCIDTAYVYNVMYVYNVYVNSPISKILPIHIPPPAIT